MNARGEKWGNEAPPPLQHPHLIGTDEGDSRSEIDQQCRHGQDAQESPPMMQGPVCNLTRAPAAAESNELACHPRRRQLAPALKTEQAHGVQQDEQGTHLVKDRRRHGPEHAQASQHDRHAVEAEREDEDVLADDPDRMPRKSNCLRERDQRIPHEDHRSRHGRDVGPNASQGQANVGQGQGRGIVDAVSHHRHDAAFMLAAFHPLSLVGRSPFGLDLGDVHLPGQVAGRGLAVAGKDRQVTNPQFPEFVNHVVGLRASPIPGPDHAGDRAVHRHEKGGLACIVETAESLIDLGRDGNTLVANQTQVAHQHALAVIPPGNSRLHPHAGMGLELLRSV